MDVFNNEAASIFPPKEIKEDILVNYLYSLEKKEFILVIDKRMDDSLIRKFLLYKFFSVYHIYFEKVNPRSKDKVCFFSSPGAMPHFIRHFEVENFFCRIWFGNILGEIQFNFTELVVQEKIVRTGYTYSSGKLNPEYFQVYTRQAINPHNPFNLD